MYDFRDPSIVHGGTCDNCGGYVRDNEQMLFAHGKMDVCASCLEELCQAEDEEEDQ